MSRPPTMPMPPKICVLTADFSAFVAWQDAAATSGNWCVSDMNSVNTCRQNDWLFINVICLPGWREIPDADAVLAEALTLVVQPTSRPRNRVVVV